MEERSEDETNQIIDEIIQLKTQWKAEVGNIGGVAWPKAIKTRAMQVLDSGFSRRALSEKTGLPYDTMGLWRHRQSRKEFNKLHGFHEMGVGDSKELVTVTVTPSNNDEIQKTRGKAVKPGIKVKTPKGFEFEGLSQIEFFELIRCLGGLRAL